MKTTRKAEAKPATKPVAAQASTHRRPARPLSPRETRLYHDFLEMTVHGFFGGKALEYLKDFARHKARKISRGMQIRTSTLGTMWQSVEACRLALYPYNKKQSPPTAPAKAA